MKTVLLLAFLLCFLSPAIVALSGDFDRESYSKGETMQVSGQCQGKEAEITALNEGKAVFAETVECANNRFELNHLIGFLETRGNWEITIADAEESVKKRVLIRPSRESGFFLISFLSPVKESRNRTEDLNLAVKVTDAGRGVLNATVETWSVDGKRTRLVEQGNGVYSIKQAIPFNAGLGEWKIVVVAEKKEEKKAFGGENSFSVFIERTPIKITVLQPLSKSSEFGSPVPIEIEATYSNNQALHQGYAALKINGTEHPMEKNGNLFKYSFLPAETDLGSKTITILVKDSAENSGAEEINLVIRKSILFTAKENWLYIAVIIALIAFALFFVYPKTSARAKKIELKSEKRDLETKIKELQKDYFEGQTITKERYEKKMASLEAKLNEINEKVKNR